MSTAFKINPRQIEAFQAVMSAGNMTAGAALLGITQPAVSRLMRDLEECVGFQLFFREGNRLIPSREGAILYAQAEKVFRGLDQLSLVATELREARLGTLRIASVVALSLTCIPAAIERFHRGRPSVVTSLESFASKVVLESVAQHQSDIGFVQTTDFQADVTIKPLPPVEALCIVPAGSALRDRRLITPRDLEGNVFISLGKSGSMRAKADTLLKANKNIQFIETTLAASARALVSRGVGISIVDPFTALSNCDGSYVIKRFEPTITYQAATAYPKYREPSRLALEFRKHMVDQFLLLDFSAFDI